MFRPLTGRRKPRLLAGGAVAFLIFGITACSSSGSHDSRSSATTAAGQSYYTFPLDAFTVTPEQQRTLLMAEYTLVQKCARQYGIAFPSITVPPANPELHFLSTYGANYRPLTMQQAKTVGYQLPAGAPDSSSSVLARFDPTQVMTIRGWTAGIGVPKPASAFLVDGGCFGQAARELTGLPRPPAAAHSNAAPSSSASSTTASAASGSGPDTQGPGLFDDDQQVEVYISSAFAQGDTTPAMQDARQNWAACMAKGGYPGLHETQDAIVRNGPNPVSAAAKREAEQDVSCKDSTHLITTWVASITNAETQVLNVNQLALQQIQTRLKAKLARAAQVLGS